MLFSQRKGLKPAVKIAQTDSIDDDLLNGLWSAIHLFYLDRYESPYSGTDPVKGSNLEGLFLKLWHLYYKKPIDEIPIYFEDAKKVLKLYFFQCNWFEVYDLIEFIALNGPEGWEWEDEFRNFCNSLLIRENSAYRFVGGRITEITSQEEIQSIEESLQASSSLICVKSHLSTALNLLSDRKKPDYRNSIKESISAVEAICQLISGDSKATLSKALSVLNKKKALHPALEKSFSALYGYTSDANGIRHAMLEEPDITFIDAKYMLVACTSFINYIIGKASEYGINIK